MSFRVFVEAQNGHFTATLAGAPQLKVVEATRAAAIASLKEAIHREVEQGEMVALDFEPLGLADLAGKYADDPTLREICEEAYRLRDEDRDRRLREPEAGFQGVSEQAGAFADDPTLHDIVDEAYRLRDADRDSL